MREEAPERQIELSRLEEANLRFWAEARLLVALAALVIILVDSAGHPPYLLFAILLPYGAYSAVLMLRANRGRIGARFKHAPWVDAACYLLVVSLGVDITSKLFVFLLFPVLVVSFQSGLRRGALVAIACALLFAGAGVLHAWLDPSLGLQKLSLWPIVALLVVGLVIARWGNSELTLLRRLAFLNDLNALASPRYNLEHAMGRFAEMLRAYHRADSCIVVIDDPQSDGYLLCEANAAPREKPARGERISKELARPLLSPSPDLAMVYSRRRRFWQRTVAGTYARASLEPGPAGPAELEELANLLETHSFVTLPIYCRDRPIGRLYGTSRRFRYVPSDLRFLQQVVGQAALAIENVQLLDRLASEVATDERRKISRDLHDGTIQPYIGLKLGLEALRRQVPDDTPLAAEVDELGRMASESISELRGYVSRLREQGAKTSSDSLLVAVRRQAEKFSEFYGINVQVMADGELRLKEPLLKEVMNIVREGLANIRRHTSARHAVVNLREEDGRLVVQFLNDAERRPNAPRFFFPRSLNERAAELGGRVDVEQRADGHTSVAVEIPV
jgi:signal transduction histidine kinase